MGFVEREVAIAAPAASVWAIGGNLAEIATWIDSVDAVRIDGELRQVTLDGGRGEMTERITGHSDEEMWLTYELASEGGPMRVYRSRFAVEETAKGSLARWSAEIEAADGVEEAELLAGVGANYERSLENLRRLASGG
jgi:hypothetical protein